MSGETFEVNLVVIDSWKSSLEHYRLVNLGAGPDQLQVSNDGKDWREESEHFKWGVMTSRIADLIENNARLHSTVSSLKTALTGRDCR